MERGATFGKNRELFVILILCADGIVQKIKMNYNPMAELQDN